MEMEEMTLEIFDIIMWCGKTDSGKYDEEIRSWLRFRETGQDFYPKNKVIQKVSFLYSLQKEVPFCITDDEKSILLTKPNELVTEGKIVIIFSLQQYEEERVFVHYEYNNKIIIYELVENNLYYENTVFLTKD